MASEQGNIQRFVEAVNNGQGVSGTRFDPERENGTPWWNQAEGLTPAEKARLAQQ